MRRNPGAAARPVTDFIVGSGIQLWVDSVRVQGAEDVVAAINLLFPIPDSPEGYFDSDMAPIVAAAVTHRPAAGLGRTLAKTLETTTAQSRPVVIGENMERVRAYAVRIGRDIFEGRGMAANRAWIQAAREAGRRIIDIGPDFGRRLTRSLNSQRPDSLYYNMERRAIKGYENVQSVWQRAGKFWDELAGGP